MVASVPLLLLAGCVAEAPPGGGPDDPIAGTSDGKADAIEADDQFWVGAYMNRSSNPDDAPFDKLDHIFLAFVNPLNDCGAVPALQSPIIARAHAAGTLVSISIGGADDTGVVNSRLEAIAQSPVCRDQFATNIAELVNQNDVDGVDVNWELPEPESAGNFTAMLHAIRVALDELPDRRRLLSVTLFDNGKGRFLPLENAAHADIDFFYLEASGIGANGTVQEWVDRWLDPPRSIPRDKVRLSLAFYGIDRFTPPIGWASYRQLVDRPSVNPCGGMMDQFFITGMRRVRDEARFALANGFTGMTAWELAHDTTDTRSLLTAAHDIVTRHETYPAWDSTRPTARGDIVTYQGNLYFTLAAGGSGPPASDQHFAPYEPSIAWEDRQYCAGDEVWFEGNVFRAVAEHAGGAVDWAKLRPAPEFIPLDHLYAVGDIVHHRDSLFIATGDTSDDPLTSSAWKPFVEDQAFTLDTDYVPGDVVRYEGARYLCLQASRDIAPPEATGLWIPLLN